MAELRYNNQGGYLGASLTSSGTTITFSSAPDFATLTGSDYIKLVLDYGTSSFEIVYLTAYTASSTTGTITRAAEDSANWPATTHSSGTGTWSCNPTMADFSSSSDSGGTSPQDPLWLDDVQWAFVQDALEVLTIPAYTYSNGSSGVGATVTANANGVLSIDGGSPSLGDRVVFVDDGTFSPAIGIYTVTALGSVSAPWVLTRSTDCDTSDSLFSFWAVQVTEGDTFAGGNARYCESNAGYGNPSVIGTATALVDVVDQSSVTAMLGGAVATEYGAALGPIAVALEGGVALGNGAATTGGTGFAVNGQGALANAGNAFGFGVAYSVGQTAVSATINNVAGDTQKSLLVLGTQTTGTTPGTVGSNGHPLQFAKGTDLAADFTRTVLVLGRVVARRTDVPGTDSAWTFQGVVRGNGSNTYSWVGGSAPTPSVVAQDSGASSWSVTVAMDGTTKNQMDITVAGSTGATVVWSVTLELYEVAG